MVTTHVSGSAFDDGVLVEGVGKELVSANVGNPACFTKAARGELLYLYLYDLISFSNTTAAPTLARLVVDSRALFPDDLEIKVTSFDHLPDRWHFFRSRAVVDG